MPLFTEGQEQELASWLESEPTGRYCRANRGLAFDPHGVTHTDFRNNTGLTLPADWAQGTGGQDHGMYIWKNYVFTLCGRLPGFDLYTEKYSLVPEPSSFDLKFNPHLTAKILREFRVQLHRAKLETSEIIAPMLLKVFPQTEVLYTIGSDPEQNTTRYFA